MITWGFVASYSDAVTLDTPFTTTVNGDLLTVNASYIAVTGSGDIVWLNGLGIPQWLPGALAGQMYPIGASQIVLAATVNGIPRSTTATGLVWLASPNAGQEWFMHFLRNLLNVMYPFTLLGGGMQPIPPTQNFVITHTGAFVVTGRGNFVIAE